MISKKQSPNLVLHHLARLRSQNTARTALVGLDLIKSGLVEPSMVRVKL